MNKSLKKIARVTLITSLAISLCLVSFAFVGNSNYFEIVKNIDLFTKLYRELNNSYVDDIEPAGLMRKGVDGMLKSLDPYTNYITEAQIEGYRMKQTAAADVGISLIQRDEYVMVAEVLEAQPGDVAGLKPGDVITAIDGTDAKDRTVNDVVKILRGQPGSEVKLNIKRQGKALSEPIVAVRAKDQSKSVPHYGMISEDVGYVKLQTFLKQTCTKEVAAAIKALQDSTELKGLVLDLRHNGGGLLKEAINMVNLFIPKGEVVVTTKGKTEEWLKAYKTMNEPLAPDLPLIVLSDGRSASASEIFAGTMQDYDRGIVVGQRSFGKGLVQQTKPLVYNAQLKLTVAKYFIPSGRCVQAIDYSGRYQDGGTTKVADSLRTAFTTTNGRKVYDGSGVEPDVEMELPAKANVIQSLLKNNLIFDYATQYTVANEEIGPAKDFDLSDADFADFEQFLKGKSYDYTTESEKILKKLKTSAEKEKYSDAIIPTIKKLEAKIVQEKKDDLQKFKAEISQLLKLEIVSRYYYQKGKVELSLDEDEEVKKAIELINNEVEYKRILAGK